MRLYTGYFAKIKQYECAGLTPVAICGKSPSFYTGVEYKKFAPKWNTFNSWKNGWITDEEYVKRFTAEVLNELDKKQVKQDIEKFGEDIVFLCYEKPNDFCHRHLVSEWLTNELGLHCEEFVI